MTVYLVFVDFEVSRVFARESDAVEFLALSPETEGSYYEPYSVQ